MKKALTKATVIFIGVVLMFTLFGCGKPKYKLNFDGYGFESKKTEYAAGEKVLVRYDMIATDTDYYFRIDYDVDMEQDYDGGYFFTFTMPAHDVTIHVESKNSMECMPETDSSDEKPLSDELVEDNWVFDYYDAVTGTDGGDSYEEYVLYTRDHTYNDLLILALYKKNAGKEETRELCLVPKDVVLECIQAVNEYNMRNWKDGIPPTGSFNAVKWKEGEETIRITSDVMPSDGSRAFGAIESILDEAWSFYYIPEE